MSEKMNNVYWSMRGKGECLKARGSEFLNNLKKEERGASDMVVVVVLVIIVIAVAAIFRTQLMALAKDVFGKMTSFVNDTDISGSGGATP